MLFRKTINEVYVYSLEELIVSWTTFNQRLAFNLIYLTLGKKFVLNMFQIEEVNSCDQLSTCFYWY